MFGEVFQTFQLEVLVGFVKMSNNHLTKIYTFTVMSGSYNESYCTCCVHIQGDMTKTSLSNLKDVHNWLDNCPKVHAARRPRG